MDTFKAEWDAAVARGQARRDEQLQLASAGSADGGNGPGAAARLATAPEAKKAAAGYVEEQLLPHLRSAGKMGGEPANGHTPGMLGSERAQPGGTMQGWQAWEGVEQMLRGWAKQVRNLEQRLQGERNALQGAKVLFQTRDGVVRDGLLRAGDALPPPSFLGNDPTGLRPAR